jgi:hypothetical protein
MLATLIIVVLGRLGSGGIKSEDWREADAVGRSV